MKCGTCTSSCPSGRIVSFSTRKLVEERNLGEIDYGSEKIWYCTTCYTCMERCPRNIDITDEILKIREEAFKMGKELAPHKMVLKNIYGSGHAVPIIEEIIAKRERIGLSGIPPTTHRYKESLEIVRKIMEEEGVTGGK
ncbi:MAG: 4Fe-4S dicluster domain-containing protein [Candidatus Methanofastidiosia archaeon]